MPRSPEPAQASLDSQVPSSRRESPNESKLERPSRGPAVWRVVFTGSGESANTLGLRMERREADWRLRWNRDAAMEATRGRLSIVDGTIHKNMDLHMDELRGGSFVYTPVTNDVLLRLEIVNPQSLAPVTDSVRLIAEAMPLVPLHTQGMQPSRPTRVEDRNDAAPPAPVDASWTPGMGIVRSLLRNPSSGRIVAEPDAPHGLRQRTRIEPARLTFRKEPVYPLSAKQSLVSGNVEVQFRISPQGQVYGAKSVKGSQILAQAAIEALAEWRYEPASLNGIPIDSQASTDFNFELN